MPPQQPELVEDQSLDRQVQRTYTFAAPILSQELLNSPDMIGDQPHFTSPRTPSSPLVEPSSTWTCTALRLEEVVAANTVSSYGGRNAQIDLRAGKLDTVFPRGRFS
jgi:hypothetical protein